MSSPGTTNLEAWWALEETSGTRVDSHGSNDLTDVNTVTSATGQQGNAAQFAAANSEYLSIADNSSLSTGDVDFTICAWINGSTFAGAPTIAAKFSGVAADNEWFLRVVSSTVQFGWYRDASGNRNDANATTFGALSTGTWYFVTASRDSALQTVSVSVNAGAFNTTTGSTGGNDGSGALTVGQLGNGSNYWTGLIDEVLIYKNRVLTSDEISWLYNSGSGRAYSELASSATAAILSHYQVPHLVRPHRGLTLTR